MRLRNIAVLCVSSALTASAAPLLAQGIITGTISGTVQDSSGAIIPNAKVTAHAQATGIDTVVMSSGSGDFVFNNQPIGQYRITISAPGFSDLTLDKVMVESGKATGLGVNKLATGQAVETVEVSTAANLLETVQSQVTTTFSSQEIQNLPTGGGFDELALLIPGINSTRSNNFSNTNGASISVNGQRGRSNNFEIDGQSNNDNSIAGPQVFFSNQDALAEVQVISDNFSAQYGRDAGAVINYVTKSGTNSVHGTAFEYYEGSWLSSLTQGQKGPQFGFCMPGQTPAANNCLPVTKPRFTQNSFGGTLGGPLLKDRLFGFGSAYFNRRFNGVTNLTSNTTTAQTGFTPTQSGIAALAAAFPANPAVQALQAYGPYALQGGIAGTVTPIPGTTHTVNLSDGVTTVPIQVSQILRQVHAFSTDEEVLGRLDYQATTKDRFFLRYFYQNDPSFPYNSTVTGAMVGLTGITHSVGADWSHTFTSNTVNQLRYSFQQSKLDFDGGVLANCTVSSFTSCPTSVGVSTSTSYRLAATDGFGTITPISSFGLSTSYPQGRIVKDTQVQDNLSITKGRHTMTMGGAFEYQNSPNVFLPNISGGFTFYGAGGVTASGSTIGGLLNGTGQVSLAIGNPNIHFTEPDVAAYFQDDWKATPNLTLNLGVRWEFFAQSINLLHNLSLANQTSSQPLWNPSLPQNGSATQAGTVFPYVPNDYKHFEPRLGFTYNPPGFKSLVVRGGYSINIAPAYYNIFLNSYGSAPVVLSATVTGCSNTTKACLPTGGANYSTVHALDNAYLTGAAGTTSTLNPGNFNQTLVDPSFRQPLTQTYSLGVQQEIGRYFVGEVRYTGAHTSADFQSINSNPVIGFAASVFPNQFSGVGYCTTSGTPGYATTTLNGVTYNNSHRYCGSGNIRSRLNTAFEVYNGLQTNLRTRDFHGLTATASYTFSRTVDNASEIFGSTAITVPFAQNPLNTNTAERAISNNSLPNVTSLGLTYVDPHFKQDHSFVGRLLGGFQLNTIYLFNSGQPFTPAQALSPSGVEANFCDYSFDSSFASYSSCRPVLNNPAAPVGSVGYNAGNGIYRSIQTGAVIAPSSVHWLVNNYAQAITAGTPYPGVSRNTQRGGTFNNLDASIYKNNKINQRLNMQLQATFFNALNRAYYGIPDASIEDSGSTFANFTGNAGTNRNVQVGARLLF